MTLEEKIKALPKQSGVYIMRNSAGQIIYIGKAKVLKNRVSQYFQGGKKDVKVQAMVDNIADFDYMITLTEKDALSLEANLIRHHKPRYNILLKDDKSSPYIRINIKEEYPSVEVTRKVYRDGAKYFGPYFNGLRAKEIVEIIKTCYQLRTCKKGFKKNKRECLNYHIKLCAGPCQGRISHGDYQELVRKAIKFLSGREDLAEGLITQKMTKAVQDEAFERAIEYRNQLDMIKKLKERNLSELNASEDIDAFSFLKGSTAGILSVSIVRSGKMMGVKNYIIDEASIVENGNFESVITQYYQNGNELPSEILLPEETDVEVLKEYLSSLSKTKVDIVFPKKGIKKKLIDMAQQNAKDYLEKNIEQHEHQLDMTRRAVEELSNILGLPYARRMECYDISNISGVDKVASGVVFIDGAAEKSEYRRYKIKTVEGANDFACMAEVLSRRIKRGLDGDEKFKDFPDLIVIDGGKGQLGYAYEAMTNAGINVPMVSLAERDEEIFTIGNPNPIVLDKRSYPLKLMQRIRDEAHRFAITYHRNLRSKRYTSQLDKISGIGEVKRKILLKSFDTIREIKNADVQTLESISGIDRRTAQSVYDYFHKNADGESDNNNNSDNNKN